MSDVHFFNRPFRHDAAFRTKLNLRTYGEMAWTIGGMGCVGHKVYQVLPVAKRIGRQLLYRFQKLFYTAFF